MFFKWLKKRIRRQCPGCSKVYWWYVDTPLPAVCPSCKTEEFPQNGCFYILYTGGPGWGQFYCVVCGAYFISREKACPTCQKRKAEAKVADAIKPHQGFYDTGSQDYYEIRQVIDCSHVVFRSSGRKYYVEAIFNFIKRIESGRYVPCNAIDAGMVRRVIR